MWMSCLYMPDTPLILHLKDICNLTFSYQMWSWYLRKVVFRLFGISVLFKHYWGPQRAFFVYMDCIDWYLQY